MNRADMASARHHTYLLLSRLYLDGLTADLLPFIVEIPELAECVSRPFNPDQAAAAHYQIFAHDIFPYESIYRDSSGLLGSIYAEEVNTSYQKSGIRFEADGDHIGHELSFLAALCSAETNALRSDEPDAAAQFEQDQFTFLQDHLLCWLSPFVIALSFCNHPFYAALGQLTLGLVHEHWTAINGQEPANPPGCSAANDLPMLAELLNDDHTSIKQIAGFLTTPPASGLYLGREAIAALAREKQLPRGFGSRRQMLSNLFHSAAQYELIPGLLQDLARYCDSWSQLYRLQMESFPEFKPHIKMWMQRTNNPSAALTIMYERSIMSPSQLP